jgi:hypothetical protein
MKRLRNGSYSSGSPLVWEGSPGSYVFLRVSCEEPSVCFAPWESEHLEPSTFLWKGWRG